MDSRRRRSRCNLRRNQFNRIAQSTRLRAMQARRCESRFRRIHLSRSIRDRSEYQRDQSFLSRVSCMHVHVYVCASERGSYEGIDSNTAANDFLKRIEHYAKSYETITDDRLQYIKLFDVGQKIIINKITG